MRSNRGLSTTDIVLARAVRLALDPLTDQAEAVDELRSLFLGHPDALADALRRLHRGLRERPSPAGERAARLLERAADPTGARVLGSDAFNSEVVLASA
jgi:aminoglycoside phosphotransferase